MMEVLDLKGGSLSSTRLIKDNQIWYVEKRVSRSQEREYGYVRWYSQLKKHLRLSKRNPHLYPKIYKVVSDNDNSLYQMEWLQGYVDLKTYLAKTPASKVKTENIVSSLFEAFSLVHQYNYGIIPGLQDLYVYEEIFQKLDDAFTFSEDFKKFCENKFIDFFGNRVPSAIFNLDKLKSVIGQASLDEMDILGNPTLENIMYNESNNSIKFIDLYDESIIDNKVLDYSMVLQCSNSHYGYLNDRRVYVEDNQVWHDLDIPHNFSNFNQAFNARLNDTERAMAGFFEITQFIRMLPFKVRAANLEHAKYFYAYASFLLAKLA